MDRKIRIHFLPKDASRTRLLSFSRPAGLAALLTLVPLCLLGFWLALSGIVRETPARRLDRMKLARENRALGEKISGLRRESSALLQGLDSVESARIRAALVSGHTGGDPASRPGRTTSFHPSFAGAGAGKEEFERALDKARDAARFFDSSLFVLTRSPDLAARLPTSYPVEASALVIRPFGNGQDPFTGRMVLHGGVDFSLRAGAPVYAAGSGRVVKAGKDPIWGDFVRIRHTDRAETFYAHLQRARVRAGQEVARGQVIGWMGQSGVSTGPHLHFEMLLSEERVDPLRFLLPPGEVPDAVAAR